MTPAERRLWALLRQRRCVGMRFLRQRPLGPYILDFFCPAHRVAVEADGRHHDAPAQRAWDAARDAYLVRNFGVRVVRFTNDAALALDGETIYTRIRAVSAVPEGATQDFGAGDGQ